MSGKFQKGKFLNGLKLKNGSVNALPKPVFYLKINSNTDFALECFNHWVDIVNAYGSEIYVVIDNVNLKKRIRKDGNDFNFIPSSKQARIMLADILPPHWLNTGMALLTPFIHAQENGFQSFYNIDADDTVMCCDAKLCAEALRRVQEYADKSDIDCFGLDMHSTARERYYPLWSFGITYTKMNVDYFNALSDYVALKLDMTNNDMTRHNNIDEIFTNLSHMSLIKVNSFFIENLHFRHGSWETHYCKNRRLIYKDISKLFLVNKGLKESDVKDGLTIPERFIEFDTGITQEDCLKFLSDNPILDHFVGISSISLKRTFNLRKELSKTLELFELNPKTPIYLFGGYGYFCNTSKFFAPILGCYFLEEIEGFIDNDSKKHGKTYFGHKILSPDVIDKDSLVFITSSSKIYQNQMQKQLEEIGLSHNQNYLFGYELVLILKKFIFSHTRKLQDIEKSGTCFILGGGSIPLDDLDILDTNNAISFASNNFIKQVSALPRTVHYYFLTEDIGSDYADVLFMNENTKFFAPSNYRSDSIRFVDNFYSYEKSVWMYLNDFPYKPIFSDDIALLHDCGRDEYLMLQAAVNMGFKKIYLMGMDDFPNTSKSLINAAFEYANKYCKARDISVYNASHGGNLEIFERVKLNDI